MQQKLRSFSRYAAIRVGYYLYLAVITVALCIGYVLLFLPALLLNRIAGIFSRTRRSPPPETGK